MKSPMNNAFYFSFDSVLSIVGIISGAVSIFNLLQLYLEFGLSALFEVVLDFYRRIFHRAIDILVGIFPFELTSVMKDCIVLYILIGGAVARIYHLKVRKTGARGARTKVGVALCTVSWPLYLKYTFLSPFFVVSPSEGDDFKASDDILSIAKLREVPGYFFSREVFYKVFGSGSSWRPRSAANIYAQFSGDALFFVFDCRIVFLMQICASVVLVLIFVLLNAGV